MKNVVIGLLLSIVLGCGGGSSSDAKSSTAPTPSKPEFKISIVHINEAVHGQTFAVTLAADSEHVIETSSLNILSEIPTEITQLDARHYDLKVTHLYYEEPLVFEVQATSNDQQTITIKSELTLTPNLAPKITTSTNYWLNEESTYLLEFSVEDEHSTTPIVLEAEDDDIAIQHVLENAFEINTPATEQGREIRFIARVEDEYGLQADKLFTFGIQKQEPYLSYPTNINTIALADFSFNFSMRNFPSSVTISETFWSISGNDNIDIELLSRRHNGITVHIFDVPENTTFFLNASVLMSNGDTYHASQQVNVIPFTQYKTTPISEDVVAEARDTKRANASQPIDFNHDGLTDIAEFEENVLYIQLQNGDGSYQTKEKAGEILFSSLGFANTSETLRNFTIKPIKLVDFDRDGINDLFIEGNFERHLGSWIDTPFRGWIKGSSSTTFKGDFVTYTDYLWFYFLADYNNDGYTDIINYDLEAGVEVSYNSAVGMSKTPSLLTFDTQPQVPAAINFSAYHTNIGEGGIVEFGLDSKVIWAEIVAEEPFTENPLGDTQWLEISPVGQAPNTIDQTYILKFTNKPYNVEFLDIDNDGRNEIIVKLYETSEYQHIELIPND